MHVAGLKSRVLNEEGSFGGAGQHRLLKGKK